MRQRTPLGETVERRSPWQVCWTRPDCRWTWRWRTATWNAGWTTASSWRNSGADLSWRKADLWARRLTTWIGRFWRNWPKKVCMIPFPLFRPSRDLRHKTEAQHDSRDYQNFQTSFEWLLFYLFSFISEEDDLFYQFDDVDAWNDTNAQVDDAILDFDDIPEFNEDVITTGSDPATSDDVINVKDEEKEATWSLIRNIRCEPHPSSTVARVTCRSCWSNYSNSLNKQTPEHKWWHSSGRASQTFVFPFWILWKRTSQKDSFWCYMWVQCEQTFLWDWSDCCSTVL